MAKPDKQPTWIPEEPVETPEPDWIPKISPDWIPETSPFSLTPDAAVAELDPFLENLDNLEEEKDKIGAALLLAEDLDIDPKQAYTLLDPIIKEYYGEEIGPRKAREFLKDKWITGRIQATLGNLGFMQLAGDDSEETQALIDKYYALMPSPEIIKRSLPVKIAGEVLELAPIWLEGARQGAYRAPMVGSMFGLTALALGQMGPQIMFPEEIFTVPGATAAGLTLGFASAATESIGKIEAGSAYLELKEITDAEGNTIDDRITKPIATSIGLINMLIEMSQAQVVLKGIPGGKRLLTKGIVKATKQALMSPRLRNVMLRQSARLVGGVAENVGQEMLQETTNIVFDELAIYISNKVDNTKIQAQWDEALPRLKEVALKSSQGFLGMMLPGGMLSVATQSAQVAKAKKQAEVKATEPTEPPAKEVISPAKEVVPPTVEVKPPEPVAEKPLAEEMYYHQTSIEAAKRILKEGFKLDYGKARLSDDVMPDAVFLKPSDVDITVGGEEQLRVSADLGNVKVFKNRGDLQNFLREDDKYNELLVASRQDDVARARQIDEIDDKKYDKLLLKPDITEDERKALYDKEEAEVKKIIEGSKVAPTKARQRATEYLKEQGIDTIIVEEDIGFLGRKTQTVAVLQPEKVKPKPITPEEPLSYQRERNELAKKIENVQRKAEVQMGKAAVERFMDVTAPTREESMQQLARNIRDQRMKEWKEYQKEDFFNRIAEVGKIHTRYFKGKEELADIPQWVKMKVFTAQEGARDLDEVASDLGMSDTELIEKLKTYKGIEKPSDTLKDYYPEIEREYDIYEKVEVNEADLEEGYEFTIDGEPYRVIAKDNEKTIISNGEDTELGAFDSVTIDKGSFKNEKGQFIELGKAVVVATERIEEAGERGVVAGKKIGTKEERARKKELEVRAKERKAVKDYVNKMLKRIMGSPAQNVDFYYARNIEMIQGQIDPKFRTKKTLDKRNKTRVFLGNHPEATEYMPTKVLELLEKKSADKFTIAELEAIDSEIANLRHLGKLKYELKEAQRKREWNRTRDEMLLSILGGEGIVPPEEEIVGRRKKQPLKTIRAITLLPQSIFDKADGGKGRYDGPVHSVYYNDVKNLRARKFTMLDKRRQYVNDELKKLDLTFWGLRKTREVDGKKYRIAEMMGIYGGSLNELHRAALIHGNKLSPERIEAISKALTGKEKDAVRVIMTDFENNYPRLREAFIARYNRDLGHQPNYLAMFREQVDKDMPIEEAMAEELLNRENLKRAYPPKGMTFERMENIPDEFQKPVQTNIVEIWSTALEREEHFIHFAEKIRDLQNFNNDRAINDAVKQKMGVPYMERFRNYTNSIANPNFYKQSTIKDMNRYVAIARRHAAVAYLAGNVLTMAKQLPSFLYYLHEAGPVYLLQSTIWCATHPGQAIAFVNQDANMKHMSMERTIEEMKNSYRSSYQTIVNKIGTVGMSGIMFLDRAVKTMGYIAVANKYMDSGYTEQMAREKALNHTNRTQPAAHAEDIAEIYRTSEFLNAFLQFSNQLNKIYNMTTYDVPAQWRGGKHGKAVLEAMSLAMGAILIWSIAHKRLPKDEKELTQAIADWVLMQIPLIGRMMATSKAGWESVAAPIFVAPVKLAVAMRDNVTMEKRIKAVLEALSVSLGYPYTFTRRLYKTIETGDIVEMIGGKPKE